MCLINDEKPKDYNMETQGSRATMFKKSPRTLT